MTWHATGTRVVLDVDASTWVEQSGGRRWWANVAGSPLTTQGRPAGRLCTFETMEAAQAGALRELRRRRRTTVALVVGAALAAGSPRIEIYFGECDLCGRAPQDEGHAFDCPHAGKHEDER